MSKASIGAGFAAAAAVEDATNLMVSDFAKALGNLQLLDLRDAFCVAGAGRSQPYDHFSWDYYLL